MIPQLRLVCVGIVLPGGFRDESSDPELASFERALAYFALGKLFFLFVSVEGDEDPSTKKYF